MADTLYSRPEHAADAVLELRLQRLVKTHGPTVHLKWMVLISRLFIGGTLSLSSSLDPGEAKD